jgi:hypothetical protein
MRSPADLNLESRRQLEQQARGHTMPMRVAFRSRIEFFRDLIENQLRRRILKNLEQLIMAIGNYIDQHNQNPKPSIWTTKACDILDKVTRA